MIATSPAGVIMTTGRKSALADVERAISVSRTYGFTFRPREGKALHHIAADGEPVIVLGGDGFTLHWQDQIFRYHPGMGVNRLRMIRQGRRDWMVEAMSLKEGDHLLDATLGIGSDLLVGSYVVGDSGRAVGLESQPLLAFIVQEGIRSYAHPVTAVTEALQRIEVVHSSYQQYLAASFPKSFDVVYFDPMFAEPVMESNHMVPLRRLANSEKLTRQWVDEACRVARRVVVVKDRRDGPYIQSGWFDRVVGGTRSRIAYGIIDVPLTGDKCYE